VRAEKDMLQKKPVDKKLPTGCEEVLLKSYLAEQFTHLRLDLWLDHSNEPSI
jgi:hypothetical protein